MSENEYVANEDEDYSEYVTRFHYHTHNIFLVYTDSE